MYLQKQTTDLTVIGLLAQFFLPFAVTKIFKTDLFTEYFVGVNYSNTLAASKTSLRSGSATTGMPFIDDTLLWCPDNDGRMVDISACLQVSWAIFSFQIDR